MSENTNVRHRGPGMGRPGMGDKPKNFKQSMGDLLLYCKPFMTVTLIALICEVGSVITRLIGPNMIRNITNLISEGIMGAIDMNAIGRACIVLGILYGVGTVMSFVTGLILTVVTQKVNKGLRNEISLKINKLPVAFFQKTTIGDILSRVTNDVDLIGRTMQRSVVSLISAIATFFGSIVMMVYTNWVLALVAIASSLIGFSFMFRITKMSQKYFKARQKWLGDMNGHVEEIYTGQKIVKLFNAEEKEKNKFDALNEGMYVSDWKSQFFSGLMQPLMGFVGNFGYVCVCVAGAVMTMKGYIDFGVIVAFMMYVRQFSSPLSQLAQSVTSLQSTAAASERVFDFLKAEEMEDESHKKNDLSGVKGDVEFSHVHFGYTPDKIIIKDFSEHVLPGQKVAIVGPTGAGKTTMVNLLMRFYELDEGEIRIDGVPTTQLSRDEIHSIFGMVLQDTWLFEGTIRDNITYGKTGITEEQLIKVAKAAGIYHFVRSLPNGFDTVLDDKMSISAGQKQLMTIARAMIENAPMLILDEATSSVDTRTEIMIQKAMDNLTKGRTSFVIAHRLSTIKNADKILVMNAGDIVESGTHEELLALNGFYAQLYNSQFETAS